MADKIPSEFPSIVVGGGCFWCTEAAYLMHRGVVTVVSGYTGGAVANPGYGAVCSGRTGHAEVVRVSYDPALVSAGDLFDFFWKIHDPTTLNGQGADEGTQYRSVIFYADEAERTAAMDSRERARTKWGDAIVTTFEPLEEFYPAEDYHQNYFARNPEAGYCRAVIAPKIARIETETD